jgi:hypothetical protein
MCNKPKPPGFLRNKSNGTASYYYKLAFGEMAPLFCLILIHFEVFVMPLVGVDKQI